MNSIVSVAKTPISNTTKGVMKTTEMLWLDFSYKAKAAIAFAMSNKAANAATAKRKRAVQPGTNADSREAASICSRAEIR